MRLRFLCSALTVTVLEIVLCYAQTDGDAGVCIRPIIVPKTRWVNVRCRKNSKEICRKLKKDYVRENRTVCCDDWLYIVAKNKCMPDCKQGCIGGTCVAPNTCACDPPMILKYNNTCLLPVCTSPCVNAICVDDDKCACNEGFTVHNTTHCAPACTEGFYNDPHTLDCKPKCDKCVNGICTAPNTCTCDEGYKLKNYTCVPHCSQPCSNGRCTAPNTCECNAGYSIDTADKSVCNPICDKTCVNGSCVEPNTCSCLNGYEYLNTWACRPKCDNCTNGECVAPNQCDCSNGYIKSDSGICKPVCLETCTNGYCSAPNTCSCNEGYEINSENKFKCQPICNDNCVNSTCSSPDTCTCYPGYEKFNNSVCKPLCTSCDHGICVSPEHCKCNAGYDKANGTCQPICSSPCINGFCESPEVCACNEGYLKNLTEAVCYKPCFGECTNGICNIDGDCLCNSGYQLYNNSCIIPDDCDKCNGTCPSDDCQCEDGRPCQPPIDTPGEAAPSTSLAGLQITWVLGGCVGILLVTIVIATIGYMWRKRKEYENKPTDNENAYPSVLYTIPNTLIQGNYEKNRDSLNDDDDDEDGKKDASLHHLLEEREEEKIAL